METNFRIDSISKLHDFIGYEKPTHPLVSYIDFTKIKGRDDLEQFTITSDLYTVMMKDKIGCDIKYGRQNYDFEEGTLLFFSPEQAIHVEYVGEWVSDKDDGGWMLCFHPDIIRGSGLGKKIEQYTFFDYESHEALHVSEVEKGILAGILDTITLEIRSNIDVYSKDVMVSTLEVLLNYAMRFYGRQFITRTTAQKGTVAQFERLLKDYIYGDDLEEMGVPTVKYLAQEMGYSSNYLTDLMRKETGMSVIEHVHYHVTEKAKTMLMDNSDTVTSIAYRMGFDYPHHFSKFFKQKTGLSPVGYRKSMSAVGEP